MVTSPAGDVITGQLVDISPASLSVFAGGRRIELDKARVRRVRQGWNDPIADGAVLGFAVGVAPWLLAAFIGTGSEEASLALPALTGVAGALIGATLDRCPGGAPATWRPDRSAPRPGPFRDGGRARRGPPRTRANCGAAAPGGRPRSAGRPRRRGRHPRTSPARRGESDMDALDGRPIPRTGSKQRARRRRPSAGPPVRLGGSRSDGAGVVGCPLVK